MITGMHGQYGDNRMLCRDNKSGVSVTDNDKSKGGK